MITLEMKFLSQSNGTTCMSGVVEPLNHSIVMGVTRATTIHTGCLKMDTLNLKHNTS